MLHLEKPVLALSLDAVANIDDDTALCLLTLFSKCKEGLQDGDRLENMCWRLWHVERSTQVDLSPPLPLSSPGLVASALTSSCLSSSEDDSEDSLSEEEKWNRDQVSTANEDARGLKDANSSLSTHPSPLTVPHGADPFRRRKKTRRLSSPTRARPEETETSSCFRPSFTYRRTLSNTSFGQIMADLLPDKLDVRCQRRSSSQSRVSESDRYVENSPAPLASSGTVPALLVEPDMTPNEPEASPLPPHSPQQERTVRFPTVVIVNPTPHPTPPMTPQVSPPPSASASTIFTSGHPARRDALSVSTRLPIVSSTPLPPTPESMEEKPDVEDRLLAVPEEVSASNKKAHPSAPGPSTGNHLENPIANSGSGFAAKAESSLHGGISIAVKECLSHPAPTATVSASLNPPERKFFIVHRSSPDGNSPDTSASSQIGSQSMHSTSMATTMNKGACAEGPCVEPGSVVSRTSAATTHSHSSNASSSRSGLKMKSNKKTTTYSKAKGREPRHLVPTLQRAHLSGHHVKHAVDATGIAGTIRYSKVGGRVGAAAAAAAVAAVVVTSAGVRVQNKLRDQAPAPTAMNNNPPKAAATQPSVYAAKETTGAGSKTARSSKSSLRLGASHRRVVSQPRSGGSSTKVQTPNVPTHNVDTAMAKANAVKLVSKGLIELDESGSFTEDEEWDTEEGSDAEQLGQTNNSKQPPMSELERKIVEAAAEAQRQRDMFAKIDRRSYTNLNRSQSGLLSTLFHPDPNLFPPDHPYRHSRSTTDILAHLHRPHYQLTALQPAKSVAAVPVAAAVNAQGVGSPHNGKMRSSLRLKGKPEDVEESDSGEDDEDNKVPVSTSVAEQRLAALYKGKRPMPPPEQQQRQQQQQQVQQAQPHRQHSFPATQPTQGALYGVNGANGPPPLARVATAPITLCYPYNLPPPLPPSTPRTTRRLMLTHELPESLRRNLLWERQVSKQRPMGLSRRVMTTSAQPGVVPGNPLGPPPTNINGDSSAEHSGTQAQVSYGGSSNGTQGSSAVDEERRQRATARNRSWANNFHAAGW